MIATTHATRKICNQFFPDKIHSHEGWVSLPSLQQVKEPKKIKRQVNGSIHEDMSRSGLYTSKELNQWDSFLHYGHFKDSIIERISIWEKIRTWITNSGAYISTAVLIIYAVRLSLWAGLMFHAI